jgi:hypothetical protein
LSFLTCLEQFSPSQNSKSVHPYFPGAFVFAYFSLKFMNFNLSVTRDVN